MSQQVVIKRSHEGDSNTHASKRRKNELALAGSANGRALSTLSAPPRTSGLQSPIMLLTGHSGEVLSCKFNGKGDCLASGSADKSILVWRVYGDCESIVELSGHKGAVIEVDWTSDSKRVISASADKTVGVYDVESGQRIKKLKGHEQIVNSCRAARGGSSLVASASDDGFVRVWDLRNPKVVKAFNHGYQVTACCFDESTGKVFAGGIDNVVRAWDIGSESVEYTLNKHTETITGLRLSPDGNELLSNAMDGVVRIWDVRPYSSSKSREVSSFNIVKHGYEKHLLKCSWSSLGTKITAGSSDNFVYVWDAHTGEIDYKLPGHEGAVVEADFHPKEPIIASCSTDQKIYLGELEL
eukprot:Nk52_evm88s226 gene=Nk52_evmTU88s226